MLRTAASIAALSTILLAGCSSADDSPPASTSETAAVTTTTTTAVASSPAPGTPSATSASPSESSGDTSTPEAAFVSGLRNATIPIRNDEGVLGTGQRMCDALTNGEGPAAAAVYGTDENPWTPEQATAAVSVAAATLCPENVGKVG